MKLNITKSLIIIGLIITIYAEFNQEILNFGMSNYYFYKGYYLSLGYQFLIYSFLHLGYLHILSNGIFLYFFGNLVENEIGAKKYLIFFILSTLFVGISLIIFSIGLSYGFSGFIMGILSLYTLILRSKDNQDYKSGITAIVIYLILGYSFEINFLSQVFGTLFGVVYYYLLIFFDKNE